MQVNELKKIPNVDSYSGLVHHLRKSYNDKLSSYGFKRIGNPSSAGWVYSHDKLPYVLKVFRKDSGYLTFVNLALKSKCDAFPKFRGKIISLGNNIFAVRMEKLTELDEDRAGHHHMKATRAMYRYLRNFEDSEDDAQVKLSNEIMNSSFARYFEEFEDFAEFHYGLSLLKHEFRHNVHGENTFRLDLHCQNIMKRGKFPVIIDPFIDRDI